MLRSIECESSVRCSLQVAVDNVWVGTETSSNGVLLEWIFR
jgi:hypothetical protein